jgi:hypothetical protein
MIQHHVIKFVSDLRQVGGFLRVLQFPPPIKPETPYDITEILLKVALNTINDTQRPKEKEQKDKQRSTKHYREN